MQSYPLAYPWIYGTSEPPPVWHPESPNVDLLQYWADTLIPSIANPAILGNRPILQWNGSVHPTAGSVPNPPPTPDAAGSLRQYQPGRCYLGDGTAAITITGTVISNLGSTPDNLVGQSGTIIIPTGETVYSIETDTGELYKCDEGGGNTVFDSSGNGNHGSITNNYTGFHAEQSEYSYHNEVGYNAGRRWNGATGGVNKTVTYNIRNVPSSISVWVYVQNYSGTQFVYRLGTSNSNNVSYIVSFLFDSNLLRYGPQNTFISHTITAGDFLNKWVHIAGTHDASQDKRLYVNGTLVAGPDNGLYFSATNKTQNIGRDSIVDLRVFEGYIEDFRLYDSGLTDQQVQDIYNAGRNNLQLTDGLLVGYPFNEPTGDTAFDVLGVEDAPYVDIPYLFTPRDEATPAQDVTGSPLSNFGRAQGYGILKNLPAIESSGSGEYISATHLTGTETITSYEGTSTPSLSAGRIDFTAGTLYNIVIDDGTEYPCSERGGSTLHDVSGAGNDAKLINYTIPSIWGTQNTYAYNQINGFNRRVWFNGTDAKLTVPDLAGATITGSEGTAAPTKASETEITFTEGICYNLQFSDGRVYPLNDINPEALIQLRTFNGATPDTLQTGNTILGEEDAPFWVAFLISSVGNDAFWAKDSTTWFEKQGNNIEFHAGGATVTAPIAIAGEYHMVFAWHDPVNDIIAVSVDDGPAGTTPLTGGVPPSTDPYIFGNRPQMDKAFTGSLGYLYIGGSSDFAAARTFIFNKGILLHPLQISDADKATYDIRRCWVGNEIEGTMYDWIDGLHASVVSGAPGSTQNRDLPLVIDTNGGNPGILSGGYNWIDQPVSSNPEVVPGAKFLPALGDLIDWPDSVTDLPWIDEADSNTPWSPAYRYGDTTYGRHINTDSQFARLSYNQGIDRFINYRENLTGSDLTNAKNYTKPQ